jgi:hypothetical protein
VGAIKIIKNGNGDEVVFSALLRFGLKVLTGIVVIVGATAITACFVFFHKVDQGLIRQDLMSAKVDALQITVDKQGEQQRVDAASIKLDVGALKERVKTLDRKVSR